MATSTTEQSLHIWRSRAIDAFAQAEATIDLLLRKLNCQAKGELISSKIERLRKAKPNSAIPQERKSNVDLALADLAQLLPIRNDLVHSKMHVRTDGDHVVACFANPNLQCDYSSFQREVSAPRLQALTSRAAHLAKILSEA
ncbi:hypothetical protein [Novosphingobium huizhouense]|uniref:hypothetical protein n=1 Tax=Novosphingobium huizhouense TaxID=2866625 RepID=UPI001CD90D9A|nr:hypothetical protein [Novosphingobium huizhouense]